MKQHILEVSVCDYRPREETLKEFCHLLKKEDKTLWDIDIKDEKYSIFLITYLDVKDLQEIQSYLREIQCCLLIPDISFLITEYIFVISSVPNVPSCPPRFLFRRSNGFNLSELGWHLNRHRKFSKYQKMLIGNRRGVMTPAMLCKGGRLLIKRNLKLLSWVGAVAGFLEDVKSSLQKSKSKHKTPGNCKIPPNLSIRSRMDIEAMCQRIQFGMLLIFYGKNHFYAKTRYAF